MKNGMEFKCIIGSLILAGVCCLFVAGGAAVAVTAPDQIMRGDTVSINLQSLPDNAMFTLRITGSFAATPGGVFNFEADNFQMPFSLVNSQISASIQNSETNVLAVKKGDVEVRKSGSSTGGQYSTSQTVNISSGTYDFMRLSGTTSPDADRVVASLELTGNKVGPDSGVISFVVEGIDSGTVDVTASVDGSRVLTKTVTIGSGVTPVPTTSIPATTSGGSQSSGGGGGGGGGSSSATTTLSGSPVATTKVNESANLTETGTTTPVLTTETITPEQTPSPTTPAATPTKTALGILPLLGLVIASLLMYNRSRK